MKKLVFIILIFSSLLPKFVFAGGCSKTGYTIMTINGIFTSEREAKNNLNALINEFRSYSHNNQQINYDFLLNPTHLAGFGDLIDAVQQGLFDQKSDYDLIEMLNDTSQKVTTQKLLLVGHSQGNFYANNFYDKVASQEGGVPSQSIGVYGVASPANRVAGGGKYLTSDTDNVIASAVARFVDILSPNISIPLQASDGNGHSFSDVYLKYQGDRIVSDIKSSLNKLKENDEQEMQEPCISPPKLSIAHRITGGVLTVADPVANITKTVAVGTAVGSYKVAMAIGNGVLKGVSVTASAISSLAQSLFNNSRNLAANNPAAVILADNQTLQNSSSEPKKENPKPITKTPVPKTEALLPFAPDINSSLNSGPPAQTPVVETVAPPAIAAETDTEIVKQDLTVVPLTEHDLYPDLLPGGGGVAASSLPPPDTIAPVITLTDNATITLSVGGTYTEPGATATDNVDNSVSVVITGTVDTSAVGTYTVHYNATDTVGNNATEVTRTVTINDTTSPVLTLLGNNPQTILRGSSYTDAGATATDNVDGNITTNIITVNNVNPAAVGTYMVTYNVSDAALNAATEVTRMVNVAANFTTSYLENSQISLSSSGTLSTITINYCHTKVTTPPDFYNFGSNFVVSSGGVYLDNIGVRGVRGSGTVTSAHLDIHAYGDQSIPFSGPVLAISSIVDPSTWSSADPSGTNPADFPYAYFVFPHTFLTAGTYFMDFGDCANPSADYFGVKGTGSGTSQPDARVNGQWYHFGELSWDGHNDIVGLSFDYIINGDF